MKHDSTKPIGAAVCLALSCIIHMVLFSGRTDQSLPVLQRLLLIIPAIVVTLALHEGIHCAFMKLLGLKHATIRFGRDPLGLPSLCATARGEVRGAKRVLILLAPFLLLTVVPDILFLLSGQVPFLPLVMAMCNAAGCYFDLAQACRELKK